MRSIGEKSHPKRNLSADFRLIFRWTPQGPASRPFGIPILPGEDDPGPARILQHLLAHSRQILKGHFRPQVLDHGDPEVATVEIAIEIENVDLEERRLAVDHGADTQIGDTVVPKRTGFAFDPSTHRIDPEGR